MAKPGTRYEWDTNGTNVSAPTAGHQSDGYATDEVPASDEWNGLFANWSAWLDYLESGAFEGDHTIDGKIAASGNISTDADLDVDGSVTVGGDIDVTGDISYTDESHGTKTLFMSMAGASVVNTAPDGSFNQSLTSTSSPWSASKAIPLPAGTRITAIDVLGDLGPTAKAIVTNGATGMSTEPTLPVTLGAFESLTAYVSGSSNGQTIHSVSVTYDRP